jgi:CelD/BcsL family acetyltransferase involved in cellulose biosynthesis
MMQAMSNGNDVQSERIDVLTNPEEIGKVLAFWAACRPHRDADPDFIRFLVSQRPDAERLHVLVARVNDEPRALLVGRLERTQLRVKFGYLRIPTPRLRTLIISHGGWLGEIDERRASLFVNALRNSLAQGEADLVQLHFPPSTSALAKLALTNPMFICRDHAPVSETHRVIELSARPDASFSWLSSNARSQHRKRARKLVEVFPDARIGEFRSPADVAPLLQHCKAVSLKSYQHGIGVGFTGNKDVPVRLDFLARAGWLRGFVLFLDEKPCAFWVGSYRQGEFTSDYLAFDPAFQKYTPGMYLMLEVVETLARDEDQPARLIDFGIGDSVYKQRLGNRETDETEILIFAPRLRALGVNLLHSGFGRLNVRLNSLFEKSAWFGELKRAWRSRLAGRSSPA